MDVINSWLARSQRSSLPEPTALQSLRSRQIEQLKNVDGRVVEILRDFEYRVTVDEKSGLFLKILLPPQFPQDRPIVSVYPRIIHQWVNDQMLVIGSQGLNSFMLHSDLGKVIREIMEEFKNNPPVFLVASSVQSGWSSENAAPSSYSSIQQSSKDNFGRPSFSDVRQNIEHSNLSEFQSYEFFDVAHISSKLGSLSLNEIKALRDDDEKIFEMVCSLPQLKKIKGYSLLRDQCETLAKENLSKKTLLEEKKRIILEKYDQLNELRNKFDTSVRRQDELLQVFSPQTLQDNIRVAALEAEEEAEAVAEDFLEGKIPVDEFHKTFMTRRTVSHLRRAKEEKCLTSIVGNF